MRWAFVVCLFGCSSPHGYPPPPCNDTGARVRVGETVSAGSARVRLYTDLADAHAATVSLCWTLLGFQWELDVSLRGTSVDAFASGDLTLPAGTMIGRTSPEGMREVGPATGMLHFSAGTMSGSVHSTNPSINAEMSGLFDVTCQAVGKEDVYFETTFCKMFDGLRP